MQRDNKQGKSKSSRSNSLRSARGLCSQLLPADYRHKSALIEQYQQFFQSLESDAVFQMVRVMNVTQDTLAVAVPNPALANYLRLHTEEIRTSIKESFGQSLQLKISTRPEMAYQKSVSRMTPANRFNETVCQSIDRAASAIEDQDLQRAISSLSRSIASAQKK